MDWSATGRGAEIVNWLSEANDGRYAAEVRLDPFATSMRNFDDVTPNLADISNGRALGVNDPPQRTTDLRAARLVDEYGEQLTPLGVSVFDQWQRFGVADADIHNELGRLLVLVLEGRAHREPLYLGFPEYWAELRQRFDPFELIDNWDALYAINYLDFVRLGFRPGDLVSAAGVRPGDLDFDFSDFLDGVGETVQARRGSERLARAIQGKVPRGRHRATFCCALEIVASNGQAVDQIVRDLGLPGRPRQWTPLAPVSKAKIAAIVASYALVTVAPGIGLPAEAAVKVG